MWRSVKVLWCSWLIFSRALDLWLTLEENSCFGLFTQVVHVYDPRHLEWASLSESLSSRLLGLFNLNILVFFKPPVLSEVLVRIHSLHWETMFGIRQNPIHFFFHVPHRWFRNEEMRSAAEERLKEYNKLSWGGAMSSCSFFFYFFTLRLSKFSTISSVMALSSDSTSANRPWVHLEYLLIVLSIIYVLVTIL